MSTQCQEDGATSFLFGFSYVMKNIFRISLLMVGVPLICEGFYRLVAGLGKKFWPVFHKRMVKACSSTVKQLSVLCIRLFRLLLESIPSILRTFHRQQQWKNPFVRLRFI
mmetsp:Transcript_3654/g.8404  ORF Transcript_3654/g.8404 Transcript_3654/m.8404 type:complete len:110 (-) Transcript_3654:3207-3536(-)